MQVVRIARDEKLIGLMAEVFSLILQSDGHNRRETGYVFYDFSFREIHFFNFLGRESE